MEKRGPQRHRSGALIDRNVSELKAAFNGISGAVWQTQSDASAVRTSTADFAARHGCAQIQQICCRLREVDIDWINALNGRKRFGLAGLHQCARRDRTSVGEGKSVSVRVDLGGRR